VESQGAKLIPQPNAIRSLRVLLDGRKLGDGGIGVYIANLITGIAQNEGIDLTVLTSPERAQLVPNTAARVITDKAKNYSLDELLFMSKRLNLSQYDVFHSPHFMLPAGLTIPSVVTIHDTIHLSFPERKLYRPIARQLIKSAMSRASRIVTVSQASKDSLLEIQPLMSSKIEVIPNALAEAFTAPTKSPPGISGNFMLGVFSNTKPHKGLSDLLTAYAAIEEELGDLQLVLVGSGLTNENPDLEPFVEILSSPKVTILGEISESWLKALYAGASFVVSASLAEGFGLPVLEAKSQGAPIVARPVKAVLELLDAEDIVCGDESIEELAQGILEGAERFRARDRQSQAKIDLQKFSTKNTAGRLIDIYTSVAQPLRKRP
jgi:glycosyltransferase involved in cell wall biosynthesis